MHGNMIHLLVKVKVRRGNKPPEKKGDLIIMYTMEKRENNRANIDVMRQLSTLYGRNDAEIRLIRGRTATSKVFSIED